MSANLEISAVATGLEKVSFNSSPKEGQYQRLFSKLHSFPMTIRLCSKSFKLSFRGTRTENFQMYKLGFRKVKEPEIKCSMFVGS